MPASTEKAYSSRDRFEDEVLGFTQIGPSQAFGLMNQMADAGRALRLPKSAEELRR
jgi:hypothetical protein